MSSKQSILADIRASKPGPRPLPTLLSRAGTQVQLEEEFRRVLAASKTTFLPADELAGYIEREYAGATIVSRLPGIPGNLDPTTVIDPLALAGVDLAVLRARIGVAENGAMWVSEEEAVHRVLPFITQHLVLVLSKDALLPTMHEAYQEVNIAATGFGVFIAGPSKTADIEQSLVIGAHGPRSLIVCLD